MVTIIAEIGINHGGDMRLARELIKQAKESKADLCKFQLYDVDKLFPDKKIMAQGKNWYDSVIKTQLSKEDAKMLFEYGKEVGIEVFFSVFDTERVGWCEEIGVKRYKIAYNQNQNQELIDNVVSTCKPLMVSGNYSSYPWRVTTYLNYGYDILYCMPIYPTPMSKLEMKFVDHDYGFDGFSDHTEGIDCAKIAMARGASIIEKHFCLSKDSISPDIICSMLPEELKELRRFADVVSEVL